MATMREYFNERADSWDGAHATPSDTCMGVARCARVSAGSRVLDIGCGTGVMFGAYLQAGAARIVGLDMSDRMVARAHEKWAAHPEIAVHCADFSTWEPNADEPDAYDAIVFYNVWPHIADVPAAVARAQALLAQDGCVVIAHGKGRALINACHTDVPADITRELRPATEEALPWVRAFTVIETVDTDDSYRIVLANR